MTNAPIAFTIPRHGSLRLLDGQWMVTSFGDLCDDLIAGIDEPIPLEMSAEAPDSDDDGCDVQLVPRALCLA